MTCECGEPMVIPPYAEWNGAWQLKGAPGAWEVVCPECQKDARIAAALVDSIRAAQRLVLYTDPEVDDPEPDFKMCQKCEGIGRYGGADCLACDGRGLVRC